ncbi:MAG TPA: hypothetical protein VK474_08275, partial [Chthoniobacterales bacterium]|nr:hypothetical protein [Chthoniobacterales bacterium]
MTYFSHLSHERKAPVTIGLLAFDGMTTLDLTGPLEAFTSASRRSDHDETIALYDTMLLGVTSKSCR